jgi:rubrerythrin
MDVFEFALQMEQDGEKYYRQLVQESSSAGLKKIFTLLAEEEVHHYAIIEQLRRYSGPSEPEATQILQDVKNIFVEMKNSKQDWLIDMTKDTIAYSKAFALEEKSRIFYLEKSAEAQDEKVKVLLKVLAKEEGKHAAIMENIVEFVSRPEPGNWLENAEWHHLDEY